MDPTIFANMKKRSIFEPLVGHRPDQVIDAEQQPRCHQYPLKTPSECCLARRRHAVQDDDLGCHTGKVTLRQDARSVVRYSRLRNRVPTLASGPQRPISTASAKSNESAPGDHEYRRLGMVEVGTRMSRSTWAVLGLLAGWGGVQNAIVRTWPERSDFGFRQAPPGVAGCPPRRGAHRRPRIMTPRTSALPAHDATAGGSPARVTGVLAGSAVASEQQGARGLVDQMQGRRGGAIMCERPTAMPPVVGSDLARAHLEWHMRRALSANLERTTDAG